MPALRGALRAGAALLRGVRKADGGMRRGLGHGGTALAGCAGQAFRPVLPRVALTVAAALGVGLPLFGGVDGTVVNQTTGRPQADVILMLMQPGESGMQ